MHLRLHRVQPPVPLHGRGRGHRLSGHGPRLPRSVRAGGRPDTTLRPGGSRSRDRGAHWLLQVLSGLRAGQGGELQAGPAGGQCRGEGAGPLGGSPLLPLGLPVCRQAAAASPSHRLRPGGHRQDDACPCPGRGHGHASRLFRRCAQGTGRACTAGASLRILRWGHLLEALQPAHVQSAVGTSARSPGRRAIGDCRRHLRPAGLSSEGKRTGRGDGRALLVPGVPS